VASATFSPGEQLRARRDLQLQPEVPTVLWVGRFVPVKGLDILIEAIGHVVQAVRDVQLCLVGAGPELRRVQEIVRRRRLERVVRFVGSVPHNRLGQWYRAADVTVLASYSEGVPNVLLESMACGTPFVATRVGGVPEIADPAVDCLVAPRDASALADALLASLSRRAHVVRSSRIMSTPEAVRAQFNAVFDRVRRQRFQVEPPLTQRSAGGRG
jgi:glycosyltransferase involved in cell wall biosynthesis